MRTWREGGPETSRLRANRGRGESGCGKVRWGAPTVRPEILYDQPIEWSIPFSQSPLPVYPPGASLETILTIEGLKRQIDELQNTLACLVDVRVPKRFGVRSGDCEYF
ncbi:hypothetical protein AVEN_50948-1 [Araneus ventricosus]|uniref:Uncharacterized protein n=1 Tax=Araneus ventricosus TaxID=182803 RepID=A0A4Y2SWF5_ARAVE|nr:hypothetical protein AVEN_50948-1 [Araneus ventricosus]